MKVTRKSTPCWRGWVVAGALVLGTMSSGAALAQSVDDVNDPYENFNRAMFEFNLTFDRLLFKPLAEAYRQALPQFSRDMVEHFLDNLRTPVVLANDLLQGNLNRAGVTIHRFLFNSTVGFGGLFDIVGTLGVRGHDEDFGQTLAVWGMDEGPYLVLPIIGPAPFRDAIGLGVDTFLDPVTYADISFAAKAARTGTRAIDTRSRHIEALDEIEKTSIDFYATIRSLYRQRRADEIRNGEPPETVPIPSMSGGFDDEDMAEGVEEDDKVSLLPAK